MCTPQSCLPWPSVLHRAARALSDVAHRVSTPQYTAPLHSELVAVLYEGMSEDISMHAAVMRV